MPTTAINGYRSAAPALIGPFESISPDDLYAPVLDLLPPIPSRIADIGAGTGRDAAWLAQRGNQIVAVEPAEPLRMAGMALHPAPAIRWIDDRLPNLDRLLALGERFDLMLLTAVWQHLDELDRAEAMPVLARLIDACGTIILSFRHGPGAPDRPVFDLPIEATLKAARAAGLDLVARREADSVQATNRAAGVRWTWLAFEITRSACPTSGKCETDCA